MNKNYQLIPKIHHTFLTCDQASISRLYLDVKIKLENDDEPLITLLTINQDKHELASVFIGRCAAYLNDDSFIEDLKHDAQILISNHYQKQLINQELQEVNQKLCDISSQIFSADISDLED